MGEGGSFSCFCEVAKNTSNGENPTCNFGLMLKVVVYSNLDENVVCIVGARISTETLQVTCRYEQKKGVFFFRT